MTELEQQTLLDENQFLHAENAKLRAAILRLLEEDDNGRGQSDGNFSAAVFRQLRDAVELKE